MADEVLVSFPDSDPATANRLAGDLAATLREAAPNVDVEQRRTDPHAQDFGMTIAAILGTSAVARLATGLANWINRHRDAKVVVTRTRADGSSESVTVAGKPSAEAQELVMKLLGET